MNCVGRGEELNVSPVLKRKLLGTPYAGSATEVPAPVGFWPMVGALFCRKFRPYWLTPTVLGPLAAREGIRLLPEVIVFP